MRIKAVRIQIREYEVDLIAYPKDSNSEQILALDAEDAEDDPESFFNDCDSDCIELKEIT